MSVLTLALLILAQDGLRYEDPDREIQWARSYEEAYEEARLRNVPVFIFFAADN